MRKNAFHRSNTSQFLPPAGKPHVSEVERAGRAATVTSNTYHFNQGSQPFGSTYPTLDRKSNAASVAFSVMSLSARRRVTFFSSRPLIWRISSAESLSKITNSSILFKNSGRNPSRIAVMTRLRMSCAVHVDESRNFTD